MATNNEPLPLYTYGGKPYEGSVSYVNGVPYQAGTTNQLYTK